MLKFIVTSYNYFWNWRWFLSPNFTGQRPVLQIFDSHLPPIPYHSATIVCLNSPGSQWTTDFLAASAAASTTIIILLLKLHHGLSLEFKRKMHERRKYLQIKSSQSKGTISFWGSWPLPWQIVASRHRPFLNITEPEQCNTQTKCRAGRSSPTCLFLSLVYFIQERSNGKLLWFQGHS